jgi:molybdopterin adenylyltransferase
MDKSNYSCAILTISDKGSRGERLDTSGPQLQSQMTKAGFRVVDYTIVPDQQQLIRETIIKWVDDEQIDLIVTTGGTGLSPSDRTPEATLPLLDLVIPGIPEAMRMVSYKKTVNAVLSRGVAGIRKQSIIINLPGSERAAKENIETVLPSLHHAIYKTKGGAKDCP